MWNIKIIIVTLMVTLIVADYSDYTDDLDAYALSFEQEIDNHGYHYGYETSNGIQAMQEGVIKNPGTEKETIATKGEYSYTAPDGIKYTVIYTADENGFVPKLKTST